jgi:hypothetical protein
MLARHTPRIASWFVGQPCETVLQESLHPLVDMATAQTNRCGNVGDRHPVSQQ